jgi:hypothetical protein
LPDGEVTVEQLKRLVEIQTEIVKRAELVERAKKNRRALARKLVAAPRRLLTLFCRNSGS